MSRPPVICLKKEEPRSRYVRREVLSVLQHYELSDPATSGVRLFCDCSQPRCPQPQPSGCISGIPELGFRPDYRYNPVRRL